MVLAFPQLRDHHPAMEPWTPEGAVTRVGYLAWAALGLLAVVAVYPFALVGFGVRFYTRKLYRAAVSLGLLGVSVAAAVTWTLFTVGVWLLAFPQEGVVATAAGGSVAVVSAVFATTFARRGGRPATVLLAYPFGVTALFLPPVVAAFYSPVLASEVFPGSYSLAVWLLDNPLSAVGVAEVLRERFQLAGIGYVAMWSGLSTVVGWVLGVLVTLADVVRPTQTED